MAEFLSRCSPGEFIAIVSIVGGLILGAVVMVADYWHKIRKAEIEARLKQDMLDRGMGADEIQAVLDASS